MSRTGHRPYTQDIYTGLPAFFLILLNLSSSMNEPMAGSKKTRKCDAMVDAVNTLIGNMVIQTASVGGCRPWLEVAVLGYTTSGSNVHVPRIGSCFQGELATRLWHPMNVVQANPLRLKDTVQKIFDSDANEMIEMPVQVPLWIEPKLGGAAPLCAALDYSRLIVKKWISDGHQNCFPPIVIHITDGEGTDGNPVDAANRLKQLQTDDGNVLLFNFYLSTLPGATIQFPSQVNDLPDHRAKRVFDLSSVIPEPMIQEARDLDDKLDPLPRGFVYHCDSSSLAADLSAVLGFYRFGSRDSRFVMRQLGFR